MWSCAEASGIAVSPSHSAKKLILAAFEEFLDHDFRAGIAERAIEHHGDGGLRFIKRLGDDDALAGGQAIRLDDDRRALFADIGQRIVSRGEAAVRAGRNIEFGAERLGETLGAFELGGLLVGPNALMPALARSSTIPAASGVSGPTTTRSTALLLQNSITAG